jgi:hypothetical protein
MKKVLFILLVCLYLSVGAQPAIGEWQDHNSFVRVEKVSVAPDWVYASTRMAMFYLDRQKSMPVAMTKVKGLTDVGISTFAYDERHDGLVVAYGNSGIDLNYGGEVYHIADIKYSNISGDKHVYSIRFDGDKVYLATGFGIVVVDRGRHEIGETYYIGENGDRCVVYDVAFTDNYIVAGTDNGIKYAPKNSNRLHIFDEWTADTVSPLRGMSVRMLDVCRGRLLAAACVDNPDSLTPFYQMEPDSWTNWGTWAAGRLTAMKCRHGHILLDRLSRVEVYDEDFMLDEVVENLPDYGVFAWDVDMDADGTLWLGHGWAGLVSASASRMEASSFMPVGPYNDDYVYSLTATDDGLYLCPGGKKPTYENMLLRGSLSIFDNNSWSNIGDGGLGEAYQDILNVAIDPKDKNHLSATAWGNGVVDIQDGKVNVLYDGNNTNNALTPYRRGDFTHLRVAGLAYDDQGNLWVTNSLVDKGLAVRYRDGEWKSFDISAMMQGITGEKREIDKVIWDSVRGYKWFVGRANRIYIHDGEGKMAYVSPNNGSKLETHTVTCLVQDRSGDIWFGTDKGLKVIYDGYRAFTNGGRGEQSPVTCSNILYNEDGINEYLMAYESITCMAVDGANRKWVGTSNNGLYLISANGLEQLHHFTTANSPLNSDKIVALAVHPETGVVFVGTNMGLQSYRSTATVADDYPAFDIHAFPNPVRPEYDGPIAIKGFVRDALVHVTDARGHVVFSTTAHGGQAVWNGKTLQGQRVASGTYFVFASDQMGKMRSVAKILIIR